MTCSSRLLEPLLRRHNPADLPPRGLTLLDLSVSQLWRNGPNWLNEDVALHDEMEPRNMPMECVAEMKARSQPAHILLAGERESTVGELINCEDYSTMTRLLRVTAYVLRAVEIFKKTHSTLSSNLAPEELADSERLWIIHAQRQLTQEEKFATWKNQFDLFMDDRGIWRCGGRLGNTSLPYATKHPILLPRKHPITALISRDAHERVQHNGVKETLTEIRRKFWIIKGRSLVKSIIHCCVVCRRFEGVPFHPPPPPPLPAFRVSEEPPFTYTGVDFTGPLYIRTPGFAVADKVWICLFTCYVTRAVHLDLVTDMSTETFIRCLKHFAARRGMPRKFISDNEKTFKAAAKFVKTVFEDDMVLDHLAGVGTEWTFNIERAPWWGGVFERMVKSMKRCLKKMIGQAKLSLDEVHTAIVEVESIINSRPLSYVSSGDLEEPLTPSHFMTGRRVLSLPDNLGYSSDPRDEEFTMDSSKLRKRMKHLNNTLNHFWMRWRNEDLTELRESHRHSNRNNATQQHITIGDIIVVHDESLPRGFWKLGKVEELVVGRDGRVRGAAVKLASRNQRQSLLHRPIQLLYPLEVRSSQDASSEDQSVEHGLEPQPQNEPNRAESPTHPAQEPRRQSKHNAARQSKERVLLCVNSKTIELDLPFG